jgi:hypothetical protein
MTCPQRTSAIRWRTNLDYLKFLDHRLAKRVRAILARREAITWRGPPVGRSVRPVQNPLDDIEGWRSPGPGQSERLLDGHLGPPDLGREI